MKIAVKTEPYLRIKAAKLMWVWEIKKRISNNPFRMPGIAALLVFIAIYISPLIAVLALLVILSLLFFAYKHELKNSHNFAAQYYIGYPDGYEIKYDNHGFAYIPKGTNRHKLYLWTSCSSQFAEFEKEGIFALYQPKTKDYHFFFKEEMKEEDYMNFISFAKDKIRK